MKQQARLLPRSIPSVFIVFLLFFTPPLLAAEKVASIVSLYGNVWLSRDGTRWSKISTPRNLPAGTTIRTGRLSGVSLRTEDETLIRLSQNAEFKIEGVRVTSFWRRATSLVSGFTGAVKSTYRLITGKLWGRNNNRNLQSRYATPTATIGIRGTEFAIIADAGSTALTIQEGAAEMVNDLGSTVIGTGEQGLATATSAPARSQLIQQGHSVQWAVEIPQLFDFVPMLAGRQDDGGFASQLQALYRQKQYAAALDRLSDHKTEQLDNLSYTLAAAWIKLQAGESEAVYPELLALAKRQPENVRLNELTAFNAFINGLPDQASKRLDLLQTNQTLTDLGWLVRGYLAQQRHDLPAAEQAYQQALSINPDNATAAIQLAKVYFGSEKKAQARMLVQRVRSARPDFTAAANLQAFLQLADNQTDQALAGFEAVQKDQRADSETWFGMSLALMRKGRVESAMQAIATAVLLSPQRSMYLSYWGKMLHQIGRNDKALTVLDSAIRLDVNDPTPRLYKAIILRDLNRPGEAIKAIQQANRLNQNRGVYRSRSLLDQDLAVQNVDLSRLYTQLGLANWAQKKAIDSIKQDFNNASAHILNAGAYDSQPDRGYAQANEALLSRLLQPANVNAFSSFNGYTSLFEQPDVEMNLNLAAGNHAQQQAGLVASGAIATRQLAWGANLSTKSSDGWRDSNGESVDSLVLLGKWQPNEANNFLLSVSSSQSEILGDRATAFQIDVEENVDLKDFQDTDYQSLELGWQHRLNARHQWLFYLSATDVSQQESDFSSFTILDTLGEELTYEELETNQFERPFSLLQFQGILSLEDHQVFYGALAYQSKSSDDFYQDANLFNSVPVLIDDFSDSFDQTKSFELDVRSLSLYVQDIWKVNHQWLMKVAVYFEDFDNADPSSGGEWTIEETTGRLGLVWQATEQHTFRLARFKYLLPFLSARIDPTDVAGIPISKNTTEGSLVTESDLVWEMELDNGLLSANLYQVDGEYTSAVLTDTGQLETTVSNQKKGIDLSLEWLAGLRTGLAGKLSRFSAKDQLQPDNDRDETLLSLSVKHVFANSLTLGVDQIARKIEFDSGEEENIHVTNLAVSYEFDDKNQQIDFTVSNLTDAEFNWLTDTYSTSGIAPERMMLLSYRLSF